MNPEMKIGESSDGRKMHYSVGIIVKHGDKYLLMDRINPPPGFACPAGHIDEGENADTAAVRELKEETGIDAKNLEFISEQEIPWNYCRSAEVHYWYLYRVAVDSEDIVTEKDEARSMKWYSLEEMRSMPIEEVWAFWFKKLGII